MARDYMIETSVMRRAFLGYFGELPVEPTAYDREFYAVADSFYALGLNKRGSTWAGIYNGARRIRAALAKRIEDAGRPLPYVNTLWLVGGDL